MASAFIELEIQQRRKTEHGTRRRVITKLLWVPKTGAWDREWWEMKMKESLTNEEIKIDGLTEKIYSILGERPLGQKGWEDRSSVH